MKKDYIRSFDGQLIYTYLWDDVKHPKGIVNIFHGMAEHALRYDPFAKELNKAGYIVFAEDHRGHGQTSKDFKLGTYKGKDLFQDILKDEIFFGKQLVERYKLPLYVFGHSFGSFVLQAYLTETNIYDKAILCGSALMKNRLDVRFGRLVTWFGESDKPSKLISKLSFGNYNKMVKSGSWLNSDSVAVNDYFKDKYCGFTFSNKAYYDFFTNLQHMYRRQKIKNIDKTKPILIISGDHDPVGNMSKSVLKLEQFYKHIGCKSVKTILYKGARHEILNESIKNQVYKDVIEFLNEKTSK